MAYQLIIRYYDDPSITDEHSSFEDAMQAYEDASWAACHAPRDQVGDIRRILLKDGDKIIRQRSYP